MNLFRLAFFILFSLALASCKAPDVAVTSLGKKLSSPQLKSGTLSPFDQDMDQVGYVRIQGICDVRVGEISLSFDEKSWVVPPLTPDTTGVTGLNGVTNDINCSDGTFDFYLTKKDLIDKWGIDPDSSTQVNAIFIRGDTLIGFTHVLKIVNRDSNNGVPALVGVNKWNPQGFAGSGQCEPISFQVYTQKGHNTSSTSVVNVSLGVLSGSKYNPTMAYANREDCVSGTNAASSFSMPAGTSYFTVYYKFPSTGTSITLKVMSASPLVSDEKPLEVTLRAADSASSYRWLALQTQNGNIYKNLCVPASVWTHRYDGDLAADNEVRTIALNSGDSRLKFYYNSSCTTPIAQVSIAAGAYKADTYVKFTPTGAETSDFVSVAINLDVTGSSMTYDFLTQWLNVDLTSASTPTKLNIMAPDSTQAGICLPLGIGALNSNHTAVPFGESRSFSVTMAGVSRTIFSDSDCLDEVQVPTTNPTNLVENFYIIASAPVSGTHSLVATVTGISSAQQNIYVKKPGSIISAGNIDATSGPGDTSCHTVLITNNGGETVHGLSFTAQVPDDKFVTCNDALLPCNGTLNPGESCRPGIQSNSTNNGKFTGALLVKNTDSSIQTSIGVTLTVSGFMPVIGESYHGGFYAGNYVDSASSTSRKLIVSRGGCENDSCAETSTGDVTQKKLAAGGSSPLIPSVSDGKANTETMMSSGNASSYQAAAFCANLEADGYSDWYLPAKEELEAVLVNLESPGAYGFQTAPYWSSTIYANGLGYKIFSTGGSTQGSTDDLTYVRCVRSE